MNALVALIAAVAGLGGSPSEARHEPKAPTPEQLELARLERERRDEDERIAREARRLADQRFRVLVETHASECARAQAFRGSLRCSCPAPFARDPEPARVEDGRTDADRERIAKAIAKRARKGRK